MRRLANAITFTFQYGEIKSVDELCNLHDYIEFTFQYGEIKSEKYFLQITCVY